jgi:hypothetical protein
MTEMRFIEVIGLEWTSMKLNERPGHSAVAVRH